MLRPRGAMTAVPAFRTACIAAAAVAVAGLAGCGGSGHASARAQTKTAAQDSSTRAESAVGPTRVHQPALRLVERRTGTLDAPVQDAAAVALGHDRAMLLGGLTAADVSRADVRIATAAHDRPAGTLPVAVHDSAAVRIGDAVYLFGGGTNAGTQSDAV